MGCAAFMTDVGIDIRTLTASRKVAKAKGKLAPSKEQHNNINRSAKQVAQVTATLPEELPDFKKLVLYIETSAVYCQARPAH